MAEVLQIVCDYCGAKKKETNHWWKVYSSHLAMSIKPAGPTLTVGQPDSSWSDACGESCVTAALAQWMAQQYLAERDKKEDQLAKIANG